MSEREWTPFAQARFLKLLGDGTRIEFAALACGFTIAAIRRRAHSCDDVFRDKLVQACADGMTAIIRKRR
jgi:hypothetical protein